MPVIAGNSFIPLAGLAAAPTAFGPNLYATAATGAHLPAVAGQLLEENARSAAPAERIVLKAQAERSPLAIPTSDAAQLKRLAERFAVQIDVKHFGQVLEFIPAGMRAKMAATGVMLAASLKPPSSPIWEQRFAETALIPDDEQSFQAGWKVLQEAVEQNDPTAARAILGFLYDHDSNLLYPDFHLLYESDAAMQIALYAAALELLEEAQGICDTERILEVVETIKDLITMEKANCASAVPAILRAFQDGTFDITPSDEWNDRISKALSHSYDIFHALDVLLTPEVAGVLEQFRQRGRNRMLFTSNNFNPYYTLVQWDQ